MAGLGYLGQLVRRHRAFRAVISADTARVAVDVGVLLARMDFSHLRVEVPPIARRVEVLYN